MTDFHFKQFTIKQERSAMKVTSEAVYFASLLTISEKPNTSEPPHRPENPHKILDIGCGNGLLTLMLAQRYSQVHIDAIDIDSNSLLDAQHNVQQSPWSQRITLNQSDVKDWLKMHSHEYSMIVCNPPFYQNHLKSKQSDKNKAWHLNPGISPSHFVYYCQQLLSSQGSAWFLWPTHEAKQFMASARQHGFTINRCLHLKHTAQTASKRSIVEIIKLDTPKQTSQTDQQQAIKETNVCLFDEDGHYQQKMQQRLKPFYLKL